MLRERVEAEEGAEAGGVGVVTYHHEDGRVAHIHRLIRDAEKREERERLIRDRVVVSLWVAFLFAMFVSACVAVVDLVDWILIK